MAKKVKSSKTFGQNFKKESGLSTAGAGRGSKKTRKHGLGGKK